VQKYKSFALAGVLKIWQKNMEQQSIQATERRFRHEDSGQEREAGDFSLRFKIFYFRSGLKLK
jgi:hypothetical protein